jgi:hypothetical protein
MAYNHQESNSVEYSSDFRKPPLRNVAWSLGNAQGLLRTLDSIGFELPQAVTALAAAGDVLGKGGHKIALHELDAQLKKCNLRTDQRIQLKSALMRQGLL